MQRIIPRPEFDYPLLYRKDVLYPDSDGKPMSDNTLQFEWITALHSGFSALYVNDPMVFVASDLLWYAVEGQPKIRCAPDLMIAFGRPKGHRGSYKIWCENNIPPQVVFEILSPGNTPAEMVEKLRFYEIHGVEEYYVYDPEGGTFQGYHREDNRLLLLNDKGSWLSPRSGVRMDLKDGLLFCYNPDGSPFLTYLQMMQKAEDEFKRAQAASARAESESARADRLAAKLRELGVDPGQI